MEYAYASRNHLTTIRLKNSAGQAVVASQASFSQAAEAADWKNASHFSVNLLNTSGTQAWPIVSATYVLVLLPARNPARDEAVKRFFIWDFAKGDSIAAKLDYVPLPKAVKDSIQSAWQAGK